MDRKNPGDIRTTLSLSISVKDKEILKEMAYAKKTTIAALIHSWVEEHADQEIKGD